MRYLVKFGTTAEEITWDKVLTDFPNIVKFQGSNYEWFAYTPDTSNTFDMILMFTELPSYDPNYNVWCPTWEDLAGQKISGCECGAMSVGSSRHSTYCPKWSKQ